MFTLKRTLLLAGLLVLLTIPLSARQRSQGWCEQGNQRVQVTNGLTSTTKVQASYPSCTVTVYVTGTSTLATLYADNSGTAKSNPFTAASTGIWFFYADNGRYDIQLSGGGLAAPYTIGDVLLADPALPTGGVVTYTTVYNFTAQSFSTTITTPGNYSFTFAPCPLGVNGTNANHYLYISGGTGTAEAALINGGTCTSGAASGTVQLAVANAHSGTYNIRSATAGAMEALFSLSNDATDPAYKSGTVVFPDGTYNMYAGVAIYLNLVTFMGQSKGGVKLIFASTTPTEPFYFTCDSQNANVDRNRVGLFNLTIENLSTTKDTVVFDNYSTLAVGMMNVNIHGGRKGLYLKQTSASVFTGLRISGFQTHGVYNDVTAGAGENRLTDTVITTPAVNTAIGIYSVATAAISLPGTTFLGGVSIYGTYSNGIKIESTAGQQSVYFIGHNVVVDGEATVSSLELQDMVNFQCSACWFSNGYAGGVQNAVIVDNSTNVTFMDTVIGSGAGAGGDVNLKNASDRLQFVGCRFGGVFRAFRIDTVSPPTRLVLQSNVLSDPTAGWVDTTQYDAFLTATQYRTLNSPSERWYGATSTTNSDAFCNAEGGTLLCQFLRMNNAGSMQWLSNAGAIIRTDYNSGKIAVAAQVKPGAVAHAGLAGLSNIENGDLIYCSDCTIASPCASGGSGALAKRINGAWVCN